MFKKTALMMIVLCFGGVLSFTAFAANLSPVGYWRTVSDVTHQPAGIVKLSVVDGELTGRVIKIFEQGGNKPTDRCALCKGERHNKPIQGMVILWGMKQTSPGVWKGGQILDAKRGKTYNCVMKVQDEGKKLYVRGYIGFALLGRTQHWDRVSQP